MENRPFRTRNGKKEYLSDEEIARMKAQENNLAQQQFNDARRRGYGDVGAQLGMIFDELEANGSLDIGGQWATHIKKIKRNIPKPGA